MYINISSLTTFVLVGTSFTNALVVFPGQAHRNRRPAYIEPIGIEATERAAALAELNKPVSFDEKVNNAMFDAGVHTLEKLFRGLSYQVPTRVVKYEGRSEHGGDNDIEQGPVSGVFFAALEEVIAEAAKDSSSVDDVSDEDAEAFRDAAIMLANILEEAASGEEPGEIVVRDTEMAEVAAPNLELLPISTIANMVKEFGKIATETAKVVAHVVEDIKQIAHEAKKHDDIRKGVVPAVSVPVPTEDVVAGLKDATDGAEETVTEATDKIDEVKDISTISTKLPLPTTNLSFSPTSSNHTLSARFFVPGLDPLSLTIHVVSGLMTEAGYNYYKSKRAPQPDYAQSVFKAQTARLAIVEEKLKKEMALNARIKQAHAAHSKTKEKKVEWKAGVSKANA